MGGLVSIEKLKALEEEVFGSTQRKSAIRILAKCEDSPLIIKEREILNYLWFSIELQRRKKQRLQCYPPGTKFKIELLSRDDRKLNLCLGAFWCLIYLGSVGARMRRGAGSLKVSKALGEVPYTFIFTGKTLRDAKSFVEENLLRIFNDFREYAGKEVGLRGSPRFAVLSKKYAEVELVELTQRVSQNWKTALETIEYIYKSFRRNIGLRYRRVLGLPIIAYSKLRNLRHASPIFIGILDLNREYVIRLVKFYTSIHPSFLSNPDELKFLKRSLDNFDKSVKSSECVNRVEVINLPR